MESPPPPEPGLCGRCVHARLITSARGSAFILCELSFTNPNFAKYPRLPVLACSGFEEETKDAGGDP